MWVEYNFPHRPYPGKIIFPTLGRPNVTVQSAFTAAPMTIPVSPLTPEGISTLKTGFSEAFIRSMTSRWKPWTSPARPVPKIASMIASHPETAASAEAASLSSSTLREAVQSW